MDTVFLVELEYKNFLDEKQIGSIVTIESYDSSKEDFDRSIIGFQNFDMNADMFNFTPENIQKIHKATGSQNELEKLIELNEWEWNSDIKLFIYTSQYWDDVRMFLTLDYCNYGTENYDLSSFMFETQKYIKRTFYYKDQIIDACKDNDFDTVYSIVQKAQFSLEELKFITYQEPMTSSLLEKLILKDELNESLKTNQAKKTILKV